MRLSLRCQRALVVLALFAFAMALFIPPDPDRRGDVAQAAMPACNKTPTTLTGLVNGNTIALGNGTTVTPCIPNAPIHMRIGYSDGGTGGSTGSGVAFTSQGISFPNGKFTRMYTGCGIGVRTNSDIPTPTILKFADGTQSPGPSNVTTYNSGITCPKTTLYAQRGWSTAFEEDDSAMLIHMRMKNLQINRNAFMTVVPQSSTNAPTANGTGDYKLTFTPANQGNAGWNIGDSCVYTDLLVRADTYIRTNILGISATVTDLISGTWAWVLNSIASGTVDGLEMDAWV